MGAGASAGGDGQLLPPTKNPAAIPIFSGLEELQAKLVEKGSWTEGEFDLARRAVEDLRDAWQLDLNIDITRNLDDAGRDLGLTPWRCLVRLEGAEQTRYAEVFLIADCLMHAEELALDATVGLIAAEPWGGGTGDAGASESAGGDPGSTAETAEPKPVDEASVGGLGSDGGDLAGAEPMVIGADRLTDTQLTESLREIGGSESAVPDHAGVIAGRWMV